MSDTPDEDPDSPEDAEGASPQPEDDDNVVDDALDGTQAWTALGTKSAAFNEGLRRAMQDSNGVNAMGEKMRDAVADSTPTFDVGSITGLDTFKFTGMRGFEPPVRIERPELDSLSAHVSAPDIDLSRTPIMRVAGLLDESVRISRAESAKQHERDASNTKRFWWGVVITSVLALATLGVASATLVVSAG